MTFSADGLDESNARQIEKRGYKRCDSCGRFSSGPFVGVEWDGDSSGPSLRTALIGPCCQSQAERNQVAS